MAGNDNSKGAAYNEKADKRRGAAMKDFFAENFQVKRCASLAANAARRILKSPQRTRRSPDARPVNRPFLIRSARALKMRTCWSCSPVRGALSLECLSRGAASVMCIEKSHRHAEFIRQHAEAAGFGEILETGPMMFFPVMSQLAASGRPVRFDFADPPYGEKNVEPPLDRHSRATA